MKTPTKENKSNQFCRQTVKLMREEKKNMQQSKSGVSLIALVITIIIIIILATIVMLASNGTVEKANYAKFAHEFSEVQGGTDTQRAKNGIRGNEEEDINYGFTKVYVDNAPDSFVSFNEDAITGYWVDLDYIKMDDIQTGREKLTEDKVTFGKEDVYIYDAEGKLYYVKGYPDNNGDIHYRVDETASVAGRTSPNISSMEYVLSEDGTTATITVIAEAVNGGNLTVTGGGKTANQIGDNAYQLTVDKNGTIVVTVREEGGGSTTRSITIIGIQPKEDTTPPIISSLTSAINGSVVVIQGMASDNESKITGYAFTSSATEPSTWNTMSSTSISPTYSTSTSGTYYFWVKNEAGLVSSQSISVTAPVIKQTYTISYNANGGSNAPSSQTKTEGEALTLSSSTPTRTGYMFLGWSENAGATTADYAAGGSFIQDRNVTLYAVWEKIPETYTITYDANGGSNAPSSQTKTEGQTLTLSSSTPTRTGYTFKGWAETSGATTATYQAGGSYTKEGNVTLYAVWEKIPETYTITYNANGGSNAPSSQTKTEGQALTLSSSTPTRTGYTFLGWAETSGATTAVYQAGGSYTKDSSVTLYAIWLAQTYTITYDANGGSNAPTVETKSYGTPTTLSTQKPTRAGYSFLGWSTNASAATASYAAGGSWASYTNTTLYAVWKADTFQVSYNLNGATSPTSIAAQTKSYDVALTLSSTSPSRRRYTFKGWATSQEKADSQQVEYVAGGSYTENSSVTMYAVWESNLIPSIANNPILGTGMQAVYWNDENATTEFTSSYYTSSMYNYSMGDGVEDTKETKWANAKTEDGSYWVWIPRFAYKLIYYTGSTRTVESETKTKYGDVDILFMYGASDTQYRDINGNPQPLPEGYIVHPAFQKMTTAEDLATNPVGKWDSELEGIWVAKYEASREDSTDGVNWSMTTVSYGGSNNLTTKAGNTSSTQIRMVVKPSVTSWRYITQSNIYKNCEGMYPELNSHQMKNSEWGAVAYLTYSAYGRNGNKLAVNQCSSYYTGAGKGMGTSTIYGGIYAYSAETVTDEDGNITAYSFTENYAWNTDLGKLASTTGNIYGVYDMSGGAYEYVASYITNGSSYLTSYGSNMVNSTNMRNKQVYASTVIDGSSSAQQADYNLAASIYGDAVYETSTSYNDDSWCNAYSSFPYVDGPFFGRGGGYSDSFDVGVFFFYGTTGWGASGVGFRPVLCVGGEEEPPQEE